MKSCVLAAAAVLTVSASGLAWAQGVTLKPEEIIAARQGGMAQTGAMMDAMKAGVANGTDPKVFVDYASSIGKWLVAYPRLFPDGTQTGHGTKAKAEIWSDRAGFEKASTTAVDATTKLLDAAKSGDKEAFAAAWKAEGQSCGGCHRNYKERD